MEKEILDIKEVAKYLKVSTDLIYKYANSGKIPCFKIGNKWKFEKSSIDKWIEDSLKSKKGVK